MPKNRTIDKEVRMMKIVRRSNDETEEKDYKVRGYASTFDPYVLYEYDGIEYKEVIDRNAFSDCDMSDVIFLYNHEGMVFARNKNNTLKIDVDDHGLSIEADLGTTHAARELFESIDAGLIDQMSFAFTIGESEYDKESHTRKIVKVKKLYDTSVVSIPANPGTDISPSTRDWFNGVIELEKAERLEREKELKLAKAKFEFLEV